MYSIFTKICTLQPESGFDLSKHDSSKYFGFDFSIYFSICKAHLKTRQI